jgi:hypothetical protein
MMYSGFLTPGVLTNTKPLPGADGAGASAAWAAESSSVNAKRLDWNILWSIGKWPEGWLSRNADDYKACALATSLDAVQTA